MSAKNDNIINFGEQALRIYIRRNFPEGIQFLLFRWMDGKISKEELLELIK